MAAEEKLLQTDLLEKVESSDLQIFIGDQKQRWDKVKDEEKLYDDPSTAKFLLDCYERSLTTTRCNVCSKQMTLTCRSCSATGADAKLSSKVEKQVLRRSTRKRMPAMRLEDPNVENSEDDDAAVTPKRQKRTPKAGRQPVVSSLPDASGIKLETLDDAFVGTDGSHDNDTDSDATDVMSFDDDVPVSFDEKTSALKQEKKTEIFSGSLKKKKTGISNESINSDLFSVSSSSDQNASTSSNRRSKTVNKATRQSQRTKKEDSQRMKKGESQLKASSRKSTYQSKCLFDAVDQSESLSQRRSNQSKKSCFVTEQSKKSSRTTGRTKNVSHKYSQSKNVSHTFNQSERTSLVVGKSQNMSQSTDQSKRTSQTPFNQSESFSHSTVQSEVMPLSMDEANVCSECRKIIVDRKGLRKHLWEQHGVGDPSQFFTCRDCGKRYALANQYRKHMQQKHGKSLSENDVMLQKDSKNFSENNVTLQKDCKKWNENDVTLQKDSKNLGKNVDVVIDGTNFETKSTAITDNSSLVQNSSSSVRFGAEGGERSTAEGGGGESSTSSSTTTASTTAAATATTTSAEENFVKKRGRRSISSSTAEFDDCEISTSATTTTATATTTITVSSSTKSAATPTTTTTSTEQNSVRKSGRHCNNKDNSEPTIETNQPNTNIFANHSEKKKRLCTHCKKSFSYLRLLRKHMKEKHPEEFLSKKSCLRCSECGNSYSEQKTLRHHLFEVHGVGDASIYYTCRMCGKRFCQEKRFVSHMKASHNRVASQEELTQPRLVKMALRKQAITCPECGRYCHDRQRLKEHRKKEHGYEDEDENADHPYPCDLCPKHFSSQGHLENHVRKVHTAATKNKWAEFSLEQLTEELVKKFVGKKLYATKEYKSFMKVYAVRSGSQCPLCKKKFDKLSVHMATHMPLLPVQCDQCPERFSCNARLNYHVVKVHHPERQLVCPDCGKHFIVIGQLQYHQRRRHLKQKNIVCQHCGAAFFSNQELKVHCNIHHSSAKRTRHLCTECGETYANVFTLRAHMKSHAGTRERNFACDKCPKKFFSLFTLQQHMTLTHSDFRPHVCSHCGKGFKTKQHLAGHENIHTGARPFPCEDCSKSFISSTRRLEHRRKVHGVQTLPPPHPFARCKVVERNGGEGGGGDGSERSKSGGGFGGDGGGGYGRDGGVGGGGCKVVEGNEIGSIGGGGGYGRGGGGGDGYGGDDGCGYDGGGSGGVHGVGGSCGVVVGGGGGGEGSESSGGSGAGFGYNGGDGESNPKDKVFKKRPTEEVVASKGGTPWNTQEHSWNTKEQQWNTVEHSSEKDSWNPNEQGAVTLIAPEVVILQQGMADSLSAFQSSTRSLQGSTRSLQGHIIRPAENTETYHHQTHINTETYTIDSQNSLIQPPELVNSEIKASTFTKVIQDNTEVKDVTSLTLLTPIPPSTVAMEMTTMDSNVTMGGLYNVQFQQPSDDKYYQS